MVDDEEGDMIEDVMEDEPEVIEVIQKSKKDKKRKKNDDTAAPSATTDSKVSHPTLSRSRTLITNLRMVYFLN